MAAPHGLVQHRRISELRETTHKAHRLSPQDTSESAESGQAHLYATLEDTKASSGRRGRKPFHLSNKVTRGLVRLLCYTDVPLVHISQAVEQARGPKPLWLRSWLEEVTGTGPRSNIRLSQIRLSDKEAVEQQQAEQEAALKKVAAQSPEIAHNSATEPTKHDHNETTDASNDVQTSSRTEDFATQNSTSLQNQAGEYLARARPKALVQAYAADKPPTGTAQISTATAATTTVTAPLSKTPVSSETLDHSDTCPIQQCETAAPVTPSLAGILTAPPSSKRSVPDEFENTGDKTEIFGKRKRSFMGLNMSSVTKNLESIYPKASRLSQFIGRQRTESGSTISSQASLSLRTRSTPSSIISRSSSHDQNLGNSHAEEEASHRTRSSEYVRTYHNPEPETTTIHESEVSLSQDGPRSDTFSRMSVVSCLRHAKALKMLPEEAETYFHLNLPAENDALEQHINNADEYGVTGLHVAVAYGFGGICQFLIQNGANRGALTHLKTSIYDFAKPAQKLAKDDLHLYARIVYLRQWVKHAPNPPPVPRPANKGVPSPPFSPADLALETVSEQPAEESHSTVRTAWPGARPPKRRRTIAPDSVISGSESKDYRPSSWHHAGGPQFAQRYTDSPTPYGRQRQYCGSSDIGDLIPSNVPQQVAHCSNVSSFTAPSPSIMHDYSNAQTFIPAPIQQDSSSLHAAETNPSTSSEYLPYVNPVAMLPNSNDNARQDSTGEQSKQQLNADFHPNRHLDDQPGWNNESTSTLAGHAHIWDNSGSASYHLDDSLPNSTFLGDDNAQTSLEPQPPAGPEHLSQAVPSDNLSINPYSTAFLPVLGISPPIWDTCCHGHPRNYDKSYCAICYPLGFVQ